MKKKLFSILLSLAMVMTMLPVGWLGTAYAAEGASGEPDKIVDNLSIDFTTANAYPTNLAFNLRKELGSSLKEHATSNGTNADISVMNVYLFSYTGPGMTGTRTQIESATPDLIDPDKYYYALFEVKAGDGCDFKHDGTKFDTSSLKVDINGTEMTGVVQDYYNERWKSISVWVPIEIDKSSKVYSMEITNSDTDAEKGSTIQFRHDIKSYGDGYDAVKWSIEGAENSGTAINSDGLLTVAKDETAKQITVKVTSEKDPSKSDARTINLIDVLEINSVAVSPEEKTVYVGENAEFEAIVEGTHTHEVNWRLEKNTSADTKIVPDGQKCTLTVGDDETSDEVLLYATSVKDPSKEAAARVNVKQLMQVDTIHIDFSTNNAKVGTLAYDLAKEVGNSRKQHSTSNGEDTDTIIQNTYLFSYTGADMTGRTQIKEDTPDLIDADKYYYALFQVSAKHGCDFKHNGTEFDTSSLKVYVNGTEMTGVADSNYNEYWKSISIWVPIEIRCGHETSLFTVEGLKKATTSEDGYYEEVETCKDCKAELARKKVSVAKVSQMKLAATSYAYDKKAKTPAVTVKDSTGRTLALGSDYTVSYASGRKNVGKYTVKINLTGKYDGAKSFTFTIVPKKPGIKSLTSAKKSVKIKMSGKASTTGGSTYKIYYKQKGTKKWKTTTTAAQTKTIKKLKKGKKYYVKVRAYKKVSGKTYYGAYSSTKLSKKIK